VSVLTLPPEYEEPNEESGASYSVWGGYLPSPGDACPWRWQEDILLTAYWTLPLKTNLEEREIVRRHLLVEYYLRYTAAKLPIWPHLLPTVERDPDFEIPPDYGGYGSIAVTYRGPLELEEASQM